MGANCIIRMANDRAATALGFASKTELVGRNVNIIVPPPFSQNHNQYVRNYIETGMAVRTHTHTHVHICEKDMATHMLTRMRRKASMFAIFRWANFHALYFAHTTCLLQLCSLKPEHSLYCAYV